jgi:hypothetical protein
MPQENIDEWIFNHLNKPQWGVIGKGYGVLIWIILCGASTEIPQNCGTAIISSQYGY